MLYMRYFKPLIRILFLLGSVLPGHAQQASKATEICPVLIGSTIPGSTVQDTRGQTVKLNEILRQKPTILVFYRGGWCPYCNRQLSALAQLNTAIDSLGYQLVAISPDEFTDAAVLQEREQLSYQLYADPEGNLIKKMGIAFQTPVLTKGYIATKHRAGRTPGVLPVPSVFIVDTSGTILFEYINSDYKTRISPALLRSVLIALRP